MVAFIVPGNYGYVTMQVQTIRTRLTQPSAVIGVALGAIPVLGFIHGCITGSLRKEAKVPYPHSYASMEQCKENVRIHQPRSPLPLDNSIIICIHGYLFMCICIFQTY
jgi:glutathione S-transferase